MVAQAYIVRRVVPDIVGGHQYLLVLKMRSSWDPWYTERAMQKLAAQPQLEGFYLLTWQVARPNLGTACREFPGALIYDRKAWGADPDAQKRA